VTRQSTEVLAAQLVRSLTPVKPIVRVRVAASAILALWLAIELATASLTGAWPRLREAAFWSSPAAIGILLGLAVVAAGALVAALAGAVPGRERLAQLGWSAAVAACVALIGCGFWAIAAGEREPTSGLIAGSAGCIAHALALSVPGALAAGFYLSRGAPRNRWISAGGAAAGAAGLGALAVHTTCRVAGGFHLLLGHCLTPLLAGLLFALPLAWLSARWSRTALEP
jgi:hypothetical protein